MGGDDLDAILGTDVLTAAAQDALGSQIGILAKGRVGPAPQATGAFQTRLPLGETLFDLGNADPARDRTRGRLLAGDALEVEPALVPGVDRDLDQAVEFRPRLAPQVLVDGSGRALAVGDGVDGDARAERRVPSSIDPRRSRRECGRVDRDAAATRLDSVFGP